ncbi:MAG: excinuclease ABC subunit UvrB [Leuconostoc gelidum]|jgi:excinuclease ABC subunit B|uniref:UvrABC system protein B n=1 Tax=Leuconostoc gelidum subsp. gelidum TaxID=1607839 RepID=A0AB35FXK9_LEUGE|nr:excinuclease ABC subunit UvrB [Leuconostoc gelidum]AFS40856.1 excinuclease ABC subunit B [Leuconostoc gelidum JB7]MBZ5964091.1 excinuclease ABC subunit UvrB [Leuconostoc gelidum subsp. gelidum]MBZ5975868.1 excinuclease ABC subunit UvrB [Leuconostoc gelidum subsp. gelidum]MBZ5976653.1 excinuclease ABC subunit UvrB [Leuconostoc gelidum subsp. gelidum]MBZ5978938.1 excinuclease ABC subunit UvrB [Leuconostoc gelidum subsp. gelidum]
MPENVTNREFEVVSKYQPTGDQPQAISQLVKGINAGVKEQILLGATGTGKTFTISNVVKTVRKPTLVLSHNKTLAGQLYSELKEFFPNNAVEYFVSYYDYYQPEAYVPSSDTFIEKDSAVNDEIDQLRNSATSSLLSRRDVIVVASVSSIFGLGDPHQYQEHVINLRVGNEYGRDQLMRDLIDVQFTRNDIDFHRGTFRVRGDVMEIFPASEDELALRVEFFGDEIDRIRDINSLTGETLAEREFVSIYPAKHFMTDDDQMSAALAGIQQEMTEQVSQFETEGKLIEAQRIKQRTEYDLAMLEEMGFVGGIENYSRWMDGRNPGEPPFTLLDFFPDDFLIVADESHVTMPQIRGMYNGDRARKETLVNYGFRLPSALDNRPLKLPEFEKHVNQIIYMSATPGDYELERVTDNHVAQQIIRPTGLLDPEIEVRPVMGQIDDLVGEINARSEKNERVFITTLTKRMAEDLTDYLKNVGIKVAYLHSDIKTLERTEILRDLRLGKYDVLIGINLLREGIDVPEVSLVAILDADKEGFLRNPRSLIQTIGRAARNANGHVIMYADKITRSMQEAIDETARRREVQTQYNAKNGIIPTTIKKEIRDLISVRSVSTDGKTTIDLTQVAFKDLPQDEQQNIIANMEGQMKAAAKALDFEEAAQLRDSVMTLKALL